jgi:hypothetical protein
MSVLPARSTLAALTVIAVVTLARTARAECQVTESQVSVTVPDANGTPVVVISVVTNVVCPTPGGPSPDPYDWYPLPGPPTEVQPEPPWYSIPDPPIPLDEKIVKRDTAAYHSRALMSTIPACKAMVEGRHLANPPGHDAVEVLDTLIARGMLQSQPIWITPPDVVHIAGPYLCGTSRVGDGQRGAGRNGSITLFDYFYTGHQDGCPARPDDEQWRTMMMLHELGHLAYGTRHTSVAESEGYNRQIRLACGLTVPYYPDKLPD